MIQSPRLPYCEPIPQPLQPGNVIQIQGATQIGATCFAFNLQTGGSTMPRSDVALHFSPVFTAPPRVVRNSMQNQQWGPEESHGPPFPFVPGQRFAVEIVVEPEQFKIAVNFHYNIEFRHRIPFQAITYLAMDGDVTVSLVNFEATSAPYKPSNPQVTRPLGFSIPVADPPPIPPIRVGGTMPYPTKDFGPQFDPYQQATQSAYGPSSPYGPHGPTSPYGPHGPSSPYGPPPHVLSPQRGGLDPNDPYDISTPTPRYNTNYPTSYPGPYPMHPGPYSGTSVVYPGQEKDKGSGTLGTLASGAAAALAGLSGAALAGSGKHKHGHSGLGGGGPASMLTSGIGSLLSPGHAKHGGRTSPIPIGGAVAGGAAALAGAYMLSKSPIGKVLKPKKMKKLYKHKHKLKHGFKGFGSSSSSSSSSSEEE